MVGRQPGTKQVHAGELDPRAFHAPVRALRNAETLADAEAALAAISGLLAMPRLVWTPDVASPLQEPGAEAFMRRQGWADDVIAAMWEDGVPLRMPVHIRCRFEHTPFAITLYDEHRKRRAPYKGVQKRVADMIAALGFNSLLIVPVHLPRARVAMLGWCGPQMLDEAETLLAAAAPDLLAAGHYFAALFDRLSGRDPVREEERARLTQREWDCLRLTAQGYREADVAEMNGIAATTVRYHLDNAVAKFGARNRAHAAAIAAQLGLVGKLS
ncbi:regulatory protein LuxR [Parvibaculum lavamentivorans DS-1]|uniref:Regulatory protein LuxR n=1 Tax=Parvibaculum lavamentivorans (strain DS-1 / DSM 13023 / NCIMB 13966) TaxID=402881 RepID=A7HTQ8_PARL1|nr:LuxR C-terminal-related transcriptional regulator [Parvibaculum lavamentivorans]ABS63291.1 regulatory protein LuxR [Parvibaculum lavamentivorans DS-1]